MRSQPEISGPASASGDASHLDETVLKQNFSEIGDWIYERTGIEIPAEKQAFDIYTNPRGSTSCQGRISYRGPIAPRDLPRIKLDLTADERIVLAPERVSVFHPYTDAPEEGIDVLAYAYEELFGEKVRALAKSTRRRDLYDLVNLFRNGEALPSPSVLLDVLRQKCEFKGINVPAQPDCSAGMLHHAVFSQIEGSSYRLRQHAEPIPEHLRPKSTLAPADQASAPRPRDRPPKIRNLQAEI